MKFHRIILSLIVFAAVAGHAADPTATNYTMKECEGSLMPYPAPASQAQYPDSLVPVFINHVGRHGARYPASSANCAKLAAALSRADSLGTITPFGTQPQDAERTGDSPQHKPLGGARLARYVGAARHSRTHVF